MGDYELLSSDPLVIRPSMAVCSNCDTPLELTLWGHGVDCEIECPGCGAKDTIR